MSQKASQKAVRHLGDALTVSELMSTPVFFMSPADSLLSLVEAFAAKGVRHIPILDDGKLCAVVTYEEALGFAPSLTSGLSATEKSRVLSRFSVRDLLYARTDEAPLTLNSDDTVGTAARRLRERKSNCATVWDQTGTLLGLLTEADFVRLFAGDTP